MLRFFIILVGFSASLIYGASKAPVPKYSAKELGIALDQYASFPLPLPLYHQAEKKQNITQTLSQQLLYRAKQLGGFNIFATAVFFCAILHTFFVGRFNRLSDKCHTKWLAKADKGCSTGSMKARFWHFMGEIEAVFGLWVIALALGIIWFFGVKPYGLVSGLGKGFKELVNYIGHDVNFTEPLFVIVIMIVASTKPIIACVERFIGCIANLFGGSLFSWWFCILTIAPLLGSLITEPAAMTIASLLLIKKFYQHQLPKKFAYATLALLFVNISIGGALTNFAAPPVLMVAEAWNWSSGFMFMNIGWKAIIAIFACNILYYFLYRKTLQDVQIGTQQNESSQTPIPLWITITNGLFLLWTVLNLHTPQLFIGGLFFFLGFVYISKDYQEKLHTKTSLLVGFFLAGLVIHGKCQSWWIEPILLAIKNEFLLMIGSIILTSFNDNAAITYLASQATGLGENMRYMIVAGAITGGGLTVIANAPNPAGKSLLTPYFKEGFSSLNLLKFALVPTIIVCAIFYVLKDVQPYKAKKVINAKKELAQPTAKH